LNFRFIRLCRILCPPKHKMHHQYALNTIGNSFYSWIFPCRNMLGILTLVTVHSYLTMTTWTLMPCRWSWKQPSTDLHNIRHYLL
jgi:hypothetical protein